jgi:nucleoside-diphosphate-sugar epimerase
MKVLVTGGAGYIGSILVPMLLEKGDAVTVVDNFYYKQNSLLNVCFNPKLTVIRGDVRYEKLMAEVLKGQDLIIPLACLVGASLCDKFPQEARSINLEAIRMLIKLRKPRQKIIFPNTNSGYGIGESGIYCTEKSPLRPISLYGRLKVEAEEMLLKQDNVITFRLATVFGISPRMRLDLLVNDFVYRAVNDGYVVLFESTFKRNYIHVRDVASAFIYSMDNFDSMKNEPYNVGLSHANLSKKELCEEIRKQIPKFTFVEAPIGHDPDQRNYIVSNEKIEKKGFTPQFSLPSGITELIKGYQIIKKTEFINI